MAKAQLRVDDLTDMELVVLDEEVREQLRQADRQTGMLRRVRRAIQELKARRDEDRGPSSTPETRP